MDIAVVWISQSPSLLEPSCEVHSQSDKHYVCLRVLSFIYLILNIVVSSYILWAWEIQMRLSYTKKITQDEGSFQSQIVDTTRIPKCGLVFVLLTITVLILWRVSEI